MKAQILKHARHARRVIRVRKIVRGTTERPRLAVSRSLQNMYAQLIDDTTGRTLCALSTQSKELRTAQSYGGNVKAAKELGKRIGEKARALGIERVCFDRRGRRYHGRVKAVAEAAREAGLKF
jgi:large subunit ribosomal protein L18